MSEKPITLADTMKKAEALSAARDILARHFEELQLGLDAVKADHLPGIRRTARSVAKLHAELAQLINSAPHLFEKPRTQVVDGLKFGLQKRPRSLSWEADEKLIKRIRALQTEGELSDEQVELFINTTEKPVVKALEQLDGKVLKRLGVHISEARDEPLIKSVDSVIEKAINAVIKEAAQDENAEVRA